MGLKKGIKLEEFMGKLENMKERICPKVGIK